MPTTVLDGVHASLPGIVMRSSDSMELGITSSPSRTRITGDSNGYLWTAVRRQTQGETGKDTLKQRRTYYPYQKGTCILKQRSTRHIEGKAYIQSFGRRRKKGIHKTKRCLYTFETGNTQNTGKKEEEKEKVQTIVFKCGNS